MNAENPIEWVLFQLRTELANSSSHREQSYKCAIVSVCQVKEKTPKENRFCLARSRVQPQNNGIPEVQFYVLYVTANRCVFINVLFINTDYYYI